MPVRFDHRQGDTLTLTFDVSENGVAVNIGTWTITGAVADRYGLVSTSLTITKAGTPSNRFTTTVPAATTAAWPPGILQGQIKCVIGTETHYTQTFELEVLPSVL